MFIPCSRQKNTSTPYGDILPLKNKFPNFTQNIYLFP